MIHTLTIVAAILAAGAVFTLIGKALIERKHPPRGRLFACNGADQHVVELGNTGAAPDAPPIVLIHGAGCNMEDMRLALGERLAARHRVILIDRAGLGWSERSGRRGSSPVYQAAMLRDVLDRLAVERAVVVGHSWGGSLAATFALEHPQRAAALVLLAPPLYPHLRSMTWLYAVFAAPVAGWLYARTLALPLGLPFIGMALGSAFLPQLPPRSYLRRSAALLLLRPTVFLANARDIADLKGNLAPLAPRYGTLAMPVVIMAGVGDMVVSPRQHAMAFAAAVPAAKLVMLPGIGHMLHHVAADRVVAEIEEMVGIANSE
jgi:pimeloyl-ACP methyl ester carboxylesterase